MTTNEKVNSILEGYNITMTSKKELKEVRAELFRIKSICTITLKQINSRLNPNR